MNKNVVHSYTIIMEHYLAIKKKWSTDICYDADEPQTYYAKWKKPDIRDHTLYDYINSPEQATPERQEVD